MAFFKIKSQKVFWLIFFFISLLVLNEIAEQFTEPREINLSKSQAEQIGIRIWLNEGAGKDDNLVVWNEGEDFPSLGIGHFIWYPPGVEHSFQESFPDLLDFIAARQRLPPWLEKMHYPPWHSRDAFMAEKNSPQVIQLRTFLQDTRAEQTQFIVERLEAALPKILKEIKHPFAKRHVRENFYHVAMQENGVYALIDYVNFKGEGISPRERYQNQGWGLAQVLEHMKGDQADVMKDFVDAADFVLTRRVENAPRDESRWLPGWRKRLQTYLE